MEVEGRRTGFRGKRRGTGEPERERGRKRESGVRAVVKRGLKLRKTLVRKWRSGIETAIFIIENLCRAMVHEIMFPRKDGWREKKTGGDRGVVI